ncbi:MAG: hypothetical protein WB817_10515 [Terriglobales bacterium]
MRIYSAASEETLRARKFLKDWVGEGYLTKEQYQVLEKETVSELRTTNIFLRLVLFFFTLIIIGAGAGLFFVVFLARPANETAGFSLLIFAALCYAAAEGVVSGARLYRYGIEEALAVCSVGFLCAGILDLFFIGRPYSQPEFLVPAAGVVSSLWIWRRFGFWYAFFAAMIFVIFLPAYWTDSRSAQHVIVAAFYAIGLAAVVTVRSRHCFDYLDETYSVVEALLWLGIYLAMNLRISSLDLPAQWWGGTGFAFEFPKPFYWATWVLIWCLPPIVLARGIRLKDRFVIAVGGIVAVMTLVSNKPYLGWPRHTWDPMLLGLLLTAVALFIRRWLANGPDEIRHGFTAARLSGRDKEWLNIGSAGLGLLPTDAITPPPQTNGPDFHFGGGQTGGGGAGGDF